MTPGPLLASALAWAAAFWIARAARQACLGALSTGSRPKTATTSVGPDSSTRPPKLRTLSVIISSPWAASTLAEDRTCARRKARWRRSHWTGVTGADVREAPDDPVRPALLALSRCRRPYLSMRARSVLREMLRAAAARRMFPP